VAFLVALVVTLAHFSSRGEIMALRCAGFSYWTIAGPFAAAALALCLAMLYLNHWAGPRGLWAFHRLYRGAVLHMPRVDLRPRTFIRLGPWRLYAESADPATGRMERVSLLKFEGGQGLRLSAERGRLRLGADGAAALELADGALSLPQADPLRYVAGSFRSYRAAIPLAPSASEEPTLREMDSRQLRLMIRELRCDEDCLREDRTELALRSARALEPLAFFWVLAPLCLRHRPGGQERSYAAAIVFLFLFYGLLAAGLDAAKHHAALVSLAPWLPDAASLLAGGVLTRTATAL
jgi:lipopolysaccharide export LptBFGC system permease protein LptF